MNTNLNLLNRSLDGLWLRQQINMDNLANYSTPGYKCKFVDFESTLEETVEKLSKKNKPKKSELNKEIKSNNIVIGTNEDESMRLDGNNVDLDKQTLELARTELQYMYAVTEVNSYFAKLESVISEGKK